MNPPPSATEARYAIIVDALLDSAGVSLGSGDGASSKRVFGASALQVNNKIFAMLSSNDAFVVKLPRQRVDELVISGQGERFDPGHGRLMKEWVVIDPMFAEEWLALAQEAMEFVRTAPSSRRAAP